jgi:hypothetical protein
MSRILGAGLASRMACEYKERPLAPEFWACEGSEAKQSTSVNVRKNALVLFFRAAALAALGAVLLNIESRPGFLFPEMQVPAQ